MSDFSIQPNALMSIDPLLTEDPANAMSRVSVPPPNCAGGSPAQSEVNGSGGTGGTALDPKPPPTAWTRCSPPRAPAVPPC